MRNWGVWFLSIVVILFMGSMVVVDARLKHQAANLRSPVVGELKTQIEHMYELYNCVQPANGPEVGILSEVLVDTKDYRPNNEDRRRIEAIYGIEAKARAGYLTAMKAYYAYFRAGYYVEVDADSPPHGGIQPGPTPTLPVSCPVSPDREMIQITQVSVLSETRAVVRYEYHRDIFEAVLCKIDGRWMISSVRMVENLSRGA